MQHALGTCFVSPDANLIVELAVQLGAKVTVMTVIEYFPSGIMGDGYRPDVAEHDVAGYQAAFDRLAQAEDVVL